MPGGYRLRQSGASVMSVEAPCTQGGNVMHRYTLLVLLILGAARPARGNEWAEGLFHQRSVDFGTVPKGTVLEYSFPIVNNTKKTFQIASVRVSTGALSARAKQATLTPGQQTV